MLLEERIRAQLGAAGEIARSYVCNPSGRGAELDAAMIITLLADALSEEDADMCRAFRDAVATALRDTMRARMRNVVDLDEWRTRRGS